MKSARGWTSPSWWIDSAKCALCVSLLILIGCERRGAMGEALRVSRVIGEPGMEPGQFGYPRCMDSDGRSLWVIDKLARVQNIDPATGQVLRCWRMPKYDSGKPTGVTAWRGADAKSTLVFVADTHEHRVMIYDCADAPAPDARRVLQDDPDPPLIGQFGSFGRGDGQFIFPTDVAVLETDDKGGVRRLYVSEYGENDRISIFECEPPLRAGGAMPSVRFVRAFGRFGSGADSSDVRLSRPQSIAVDKKSGRLIVADSCNHRIGVFSLEGELVRWLGSPEGAGEGPGAFKYPYGLVVPGDGSAIVSEYGNNRVQRIELESGACLGIYGLGGRARGQLVTPWALAIIGDEAFVLDSGNNRVQVFDRPRGTRRVVAQREEGRGGP